MKTSRQAINEVIKLIQMRQQKLGESFLDGQIQVEDYAKTRGICLGLKLALMDVSKVLRDLDSES